MIITRQPQAALRPFIKTVWATTLQNLPESNLATRERVLPTGNIGIIIVPKSISERSPL